MEPFSGRFARRRPSPVSHAPGVAPDRLDDGEPQLDVGIPSDVGATPPPASVRLDAPSLLVAWSFRGVGLGARLLHAQAPAQAQGRSAFTIGAGRGAHAPVSPAYVGHDDHALVERDGEGAGAGFLLRLTPVMRAMLLTDGSCLELAPDMGRVEAGLALRPTDLLRVE